MYNAFRSMIWMDMTDVLGREERLKKKSVRVNNIDKTMQKTQKRQQTA